MKRSNYFSVGVTVMVAFFMSMNFVACAKKNVEPANQPEKEIKAEAKPEPVPQEVKKETAPAEPPIVFGKGEIKVTTATVTAIDIKKRIVTLKKTSGEELTLAVDKKAKNLKQVKVGDKVTTKYYESLTVRVLQPGEAEVPQAASESLITAPEGQKPAGVATSQFATTATIMKIDKKKSKAVLKFADGVSHEIDVQQPEYLDKVKVGDRLEIVQTESFALQVKTSTKKKNATTK